MFRVLLNLFNPRDITETGELKRDRNSLLEAAVVLAIIGVLWMLFWGLMGNFSGILWGVVLLALSAGLFIRNGVSFSQMFRRAKWGEDNGTYMAFDDVQIRMVEHELKLWVDAQDLIKSLGLAKQFDATRLRKAFAGYSARECMADPGNDKRLVLSQAGCERFLTQRIQKPQSAATRAGQPDAKAKLQEDMQQRQAGRCLAWLQRDVFRVYANRTGTSSTSQRNKVEEHKVYEQQLPTAERLKPPGEREPQQPDPPKTGVYTKL